MQKEGQSQLAAGGLRLSSERFFMSDLPLWSWFISSMNNASVYTLICLFWILFFDCARPCQQQTCLTALNQENVHFCPDLPEVSE